MTILDASVILGACSTEASVAETKRLEQEEAALFDALTHASQQGDVAAIQRASDALAEAAESRSDALEQATLQAVAGGTAKLELKSPLFNGDVGAISDIDQVIDGNEDRATWAWELRGNKPGDYRFSLVLSIRDAAGEDLLIVNEREEVTLHVDGTFPYYAGRVLANIGAFFTSVAGIVTSAGTILSGLGLGYLIRQRKGDTVSVGGKT